MDRQKLFVIATAFVVLSSVDGWAKEKPKTSVKIEVNKDRGGGNSVKAIVEHKQGNVTGGASHTQNSDGTRETDVYIKGEF